MCDAFSTPPQSPLRGGGGGFFPESPAKSPARVLSPARVVFDAYHSSPDVEEVDAGPILVIPASPRKMSKCSSLTVGGKRDLLMQSPGQGFHRRSRSGHVRTLSVDHNVRINPFSPNGVQLGTCDVTRYASPARSRCMGTPSRGGLASPALSPAPGLLSPAVAHIPLPPSSAPGALLLPEQPLQTPTAPSLAATQRRPLRRRALSAVPVPKTATPQRNSTPPAQPTAAPGTPPSPVRTTASEAPLSPRPHLLDCLGVTSPSRHSPLTARAGRPPAHPVAHEGANYPQPLAEGCGLQHRYFKYWGATEWAQAGSDPNKNTFTKDEAIIHEDDVCVVYKVIRELDGMFYCVKAYKDNITAANKEAYLAEVRALSACENYGALRYIDSFLEQKIQRRRPVQRLYIVTELMFPLRHISPQELFDLPAADAMATPPENDLFKSSFTIGLERRSSFMNDDCPMPPVEEFTFESLSAAQQSHVVTKIKEIGDSVCNALIGLHRAGIVHRDVSLDAIVATSKHGSGVVCRLGVFQNVLEEADQRPEFAVLKHQDFFLLGLALLELLGRFTGEYCEALRSSDVFIVQNEARWTTFVNAFARDLDAVQITGALPGVLIAYVRQLMLSDAHVAAPRCTSLLADCSASAAYMEFLSDEIAKEEKRHRTRTARAKHDVMPSLLGGSSPQSAGSAASTDPASPSGFVYSGQHDPDAITDFTMDSSDEGSVVRGGGRGGAFEAPLFDQLESSLSMSMSMSMRPLVMSP
eukprot:TRINITY_DN32344_c0_g1_i1.p1 TRINITY_DN32344_c0_g1~~TRINITY_DN32344_c0_g1_i1.p1  ORF type:complete len:753 (+),score=241.82 TRINITY_DN32344_c0_g1_i1:87-2345(+)